MAALSETRDLGCPWCGAENRLLIDLTAGRRQSYVEDCQVCCQPWEVVVLVDDEGDAEVELRRVNE